MRKKINGRGAGALAVALAYTIWGLLTVFWNLLNRVDPVYILAQRIIWSMVFMGIVIIVLRRTGEIRALFRDKRAMLLSLVCGILITINWGVYIYAVNSSHVLDASLGYFIEPVLVGLMGLIVFREKPSILEKITYVFAAAGLVFIVVKTGTFPILSILIAGSFAVYGAVKKNLQLSPEASLFAETLWMTLPALIFTVVSEMKGTGSVGVLQGWQFLLLPACGVVTSIPLLMFNIGVKKIPYYLSGIIMYINPTLQFLMGTFYFKEPMDKNRLIAFVIIWIGVLFTLIDKIILAVKEKKAA